MDNRDRLRTAAHALMAAAEVLDEETAAQLRDVARTIRGAILHGSLPDQTVLSGLARLMAALGRTYAVIGGLAVTIHGQERATEDVDVLIDELPGAEHLRDAEFMGRFGFYKARSATGKHLVLDHKNGQCEALPVDSAVRDWALRTAKPHLVLGTSMPVISAEALVVLKLKAMSNAPARRAKDRPDIVSVLEANPQIHYALIESWLTEIEREMLAKDRP